MRRAKIVCTLGPATSTPTRIRELIVAGMDIARLNLSHGEYSAHEKVYRAVRQASDATGHAVGILVDLQGPKIRTGRFADGPVMLQVGDRFTITTDDILGDQHRVSTTFKGMPGDVRSGDLLLVDDGKVTLRAVEVTDTDIVTEFAGVVRRSEAEGHETLACAADLACADLGAGFDRACLSR